MTTKHVNEFMTNVRESITTSLVESLQTDGDPSVFNDLIDDLCSKISEHTDRLIANTSSVSNSSPAKGKGKAAAAAAKGDKKQNNYTLWVKLASHIRKGKNQHPAGKAELVVTENFRDLTTNSAVKYMAKKDQLNLVGKTMTVHDLLTSLSADSALGKEKDLTITAVCWGLMPKEFRDNLVTSVY